MKESIGSTASLNIALTFIAIVFAFLAASLSYYKAFKVNNIITSAIEKYEGFNTLAINEINLKLDNIGYQKYSTNCNSTKNFNGQTYTLVENAVNGICVYIHNDSNSKSYEYGVVSYMTINLPVISDFVKIPVNTVTSEIYGCFGDNADYGNTQIGTTNCQ